MKMDPAAAKIPVTILTGFLGSGKTTLLNRLLRQPDMTGTLAIINEFGEIALDHLLVETSQERLAVLDNGCVCCTVREDLVTTLKDVSSNPLVGGHVIERVVLETTGLADPAPILHALMAEPELLVRFRVAGVLATLDAINGPGTLEAHAEARKQLAVADRVILTKTDLCEPRQEGIATDWLDELAPAAKLARADDVELDQLLALVHEQGGEAADVLGSVERAAARAHHHHDCEEHGCETHHGDGAHSDIQTFALVIEEPVEWQSFRQWLDYFASIRGADLLRMKGLVNIAGRPGKPMLLHGVQHVFHPPRELDFWPSDDHRTRLVFIVRNMSRATIENTLARFADIAPDRLNGAAA